MLFVVAGYPASGKSTALGLAAFKNARLFPDGLSDAFRQALPRALVDETAPTQVKLDAGMWLTWADAPAFARATARPPDLVYHMDLLLHLIMDVALREAPDLDDAAMRTSFERFFSGPIATAYAARAVATVFPDFAVVRNRWAARLENECGQPGDVIRAKHRLIFSPQGFDTYRRCITIWQDVASGASTHAWLVRGGRRGNGLPFHPVNADGTPGAATSAIRLG